MLSSPILQLLTSEMSALSSRLKWTKPAGPALIKCFGVIEKKSFTLGFSPKRNFFDLFKEIAGRSDL